MNGGDSLVLILRKVSHTLIKDRKCCTFGSKWWQFFHAWTTIGLWWVDHCFFTKVNHNSRFLPSTVHKRWQIFCFFINYIYINNITIIYNYSNKQIITLENATLQSWSCIFWDSVSNVVNQRVINKASKIQNGTINIGMTRKDYIRRKWGEGYLHAKKWHWFVSFCILHV